MPQLEKNFIYKKYYFWKILLYYFPLLEENFTGFVLILPDIIW